MGSLDFPDLYIDGAWRPGGGRRHTVYSASSEAPIGSVGTASLDAVDAAVHAAWDAFHSGWGRTTPAERSEFLSRLSSALDGRKQQIAELVSQEVGTPIRLSLPIQAGQPIAIAQAYAELARSYAFERTIGHSLVVREPGGVVAAITPWNYPLHQIMAKVAAALAAGCTVVLKPSELAPLNACLLAEVCAEIELPRGVFNLVHGTGVTVGEALVSHPAVDHVSFTGSVAAGKRVLVLAADTIKKVTLELGGKSACVLLDDAPLEKAVTTGVRNALLNSGQTCSAWTRLVVPRAQVADALAIARTTIAALPMGDPLDPATRLGPLISAAQRARVERYIEVGRREGARLVAGGGRPAGLPRGHYVEATIFADVTPAMTIAQDEIFGPVLAVLAYDTEDQAIAIANDTIYGLAGAVWSSDAERALRVARRIRAGQVDINGGRYNLAAPFGGYKQSGIGREFGEAGLEEYLQIKAMAQ